MLLRTSPLSKLTLHGHSNTSFSNFNGKKCFSISSAVANAHAHPKLVKKQDAFFATPTVPFRVANTFDRMPCLTKLNKPGDADKIRQHMELVTHIERQRSDGFFHREFLSELTSEELIGMENLYATAGQRLFHQAFLNPDWFSDNLGIANYRLLFAIATHMDDPGIAHSISDLLVDGHQIFAEGALLSMLFGLRRKMENPKVLVEWQAGTFQFVGVNKVGPIDPVLRSAELSFDYHDPVTNTGYEIKFTKSFLSANRQLGSVNGRRLQNQVAKYAAWLSKDPTRKVELVFIGVPNLELMAHMANACPKEFISRFQVSIYPGFLTDKPILIAPLVDVVSDSDFYLTLWQRLRPLPNDSETDIGVLIKFIHNLKNSLFHASSFLGKLIPIAERFEAVSKFLQLNSNTNFAGSLTPLINELAHEFRTLPSKGKNFSDAEISHMRALVGIVLASLRDLFYHNHPEATLDFVIKAQKLLLVMKSASNLSNLDIF